MFQCSRRRLALVVAHMWDWLSENIQVEVKFRADRLPTIESSGDPVNKKGLRIGATKEMIDEMVGADEIAFRFIMPNDVVVINDIFHAGAIREAVKPILKSCPVE